MRKLVAVALMLGAVIHAGSVAAQGPEMRAAAPEGSARGLSGNDRPPISIDELPIAAADGAAEHPVAPFELLGEPILPGERRTISLELSESFTGGAVATPVQVIHGAHTGPALCLIAGVHGDEVVGIEVVRRAVEHVSASDLHGTVVAVPVANPVGFRRLSRYLPDRRDLNRHFPGRSYGSSASRIAHRLFDGVIRNCDLVVDFHSGSFHRANLPQVRADLSDPILLAIANWFGAPVVVDSRGAAGTLRAAATTEGIDALLYEAGEPMRFDEASVQTGVLGVLRLMNSMQMRRLEGDVVPASEVFRGSHWIRSDSGGIFLGAVELGAWVDAGDEIGSVTSPFTNERRKIVARMRGRVIGRAVDQVVTPGYALYHIGTIKPAEQTMNGSDAVVEDPSDRLESDERPE